MITLRIKNTDDIPAAIREQAAAHGVERAVVTAVFGTVSGLTVRSTADCGGDRTVDGGWSAHADIWGTGELTKSWCDLWVTAAADGRQVAAGQLVRARVGVYGVRVYLEPLPVQVPAQADLVRDVSADVS